MKRYFLTKSKAESTCGAMKRNVLFVLLALSVLSASYAQDGGGRGGPRGQHGAPPAPAPAQTLTVTGTLGLLRGMPVLEDGGTSYYVPDILRYAGFIEGLKEGAKVTLEGQLAPANRQEANAKMLRVTKLTIGSKSYELAAGMPPRGGPPRQ
jgi:hypothetical protein